MSEYLMHDCKMGYNRFFYILSDFQLTFSQSYFISEMIVMKLCYLFFKRSLFNIAIYEEM